MTLNNNETTGTTNNQITPNNTSMSIAVDSNSESRLGIINVMFTLDKSILNWAAETFYDGKIETIEDASTINGNTKTILVPNSDKYKCKKCGSIRTRSDWDYMICKGTPENSHPVEYREPINWYPLCSKTGISFLLAQLQMGINPNIQTANFGKNINDVKNKADLDYKLTNLATNLSISIIGSLLSDKKNYATWILESPNYELLPQVYNIPFLTSIMTALALNLLASYTKGKNIIL